MRSHEISKAADQIIEGQKVDTVVDRLIRGDFAEKEEPKRMPTRVPASDLPFDLGDAETR